MSGPIVAHTINGVKQVSGSSTRKIYEALNSGALKARKNGKRTIILDEDLRAWLNSLPAYEPSLAA